MCVHSGRSKSEEIELDLKKLDKDDVMMAMVVVLGTDGMLQWSVWRRGDPNGLHGGETDNGQSDRRLGEEGGLSELKEVEKWNCVP